MSIKKKPLESGLKIPRAYCIRGGDKLKDAEKSHLLFVEKAYKRVWKVGRK